MFINRNHELIHLENEYSKNTAKFVVMVILRISEKVYETSAPSTFSC